MKTVNIFSFIIATICVHFPVAASPDSGMTPTMTGPMMTDPMMAAAGRMASADSMMSVSVASMTSGSASGMAAIPATLPTGASVAGPLSIGYLRGASSRCLKKGPCYILRRQFHIRYVPQRFVRYVYVKIGGPAGFFGGPFLGAHGRPFPRAYGGPFPGAYGGPFQRARGELFQRIMGGPFPGAHGGPFPGQYGYTRGYNGGYTGSYNAFHGGFRTNGYYGRKH